MPTTSTNTPHTNAQNTEDNQNNYLITTERGHFCLTLFTRCFILDRLEYIKNETFFCNLKLGLQLPIRFYFLLNKHKLKKNGFLVGFFFFVWYYKW